MASLIDEQSSSDIQDIGKKVIKQLKTYTFFVYYQRTKTKKTQSVCLEKVAFKLKDAKNSFHQKYADNSKSIQLYFCDVDNEYDLNNSLIDLKASSQQNKTKIVFLTPESTLLHIIHKAALFNLNLFTIPFCLYNYHHISDLSNFLGWGQCSLSLTQFSVNQIQPYVRKWVSSPTQKIDMWQIEMKVQQDNGLIHKIGEGKIIEDFSKNKIHKQYFLSSFSIGYHPELTVDFEQKKSKQKSIYNKLLYTIEGLKKFCCVGSPSMKSSTGIVKVDFKDEKGEHQMLKEFRQFEGDQEQDILQSKKIKNKRKVLSIVGSNVDRFHGEKLENTNSRMNDGKLQLLTYSALNEYKKISSISGEIKIKLSPESVVYLQVNDSCYRLEQPLQLTIKHYSKVKVIINKQTLQC